MDAIAKIKNDSGSGSYRSTTMFRDCLKSLLILYIRPLNPPILGDLNKRILESPPVLGDFRGPA
jgi:hypothetical protein